MSNCELGICMDSRNMLCTYPTCKRLKNDFALEILHRFGTSSPLLSLASSTGTLVNARITPLRSHRTFK
jgi:hypothetical protein